tara:strand:- start:987 stop:1496 length:510 start_codon:yes stop_codon:yes gene_type:complete
MHHVSKKVKNFNTNTENKDEWLTPPYIPKALGVFDLDPCQPIKPPFTHATKGYNISHNGLSQEWKGRIWCNPPYGKQTFKWISRLADHGDGIALIFARTDTIGFYEQVFNRAHGILFLKGRLKFHHVEGHTTNTAAAPSCLIAYGLRNLIALEDAVNNGDLIGKVVRLY